MFRGWIMTHRRRCPLRQWYSHQIPNRSTHSPHGIPARPVPPAGAASTSDSASAGAAPAAVCASAALRSNICFAAARPEQITRLKRSKRTSTHAIEMFCTPPGAIMKYIGDGGASAPPPRKRAASADTAGMWGGMRFAGISSVPEFRQRTGGPNFLRKTTKALEPKGVQGL